MCQSKSVESAFFDSCFPQTYAYKAKHHVARVFNAVGVSESFLQPETSPNVPLIKFDGSYWVNIVLDQACLPCLLASVVFNKPTLTKPSMQICNTGRWVLLFDLE